MNYNIPQTNPTDTRQNSLLSVVSNTAALGIVSNPPSSSLAAAEQPLPAITTVPTSSPGGSADFFSSLRTEVPINSRSVNPSAEFPSPPLQRSLSTGMLVAGAELSPPPLSITADEQPSAQSLQIPRLRRVMLITEVPPPLLTTREEVPAQSLQRSFSTNMLIESLRSSSVPEQQTNEEDTRNQIVALAEEGTEILGFPELSEDDDELDNASENGSSASSLSSLSEDEVLGNRNGFLNLR